MDNIKQLEIKKVWKKELAYLSDFSFQKIQVNDKTLIVHNRAELSTELLGKYLTADNLVTKYDNYGNVEYHTTSKTILILTDSAVIPIINANLLFCKFCKKQYFLEKPKKSISNIQKEIHGVNDAIYAWEGGW